MAQQTTDQSIFENKSTLIEEAITLPELSYTERSPVMSPKTIAHTHIRQIDHDLDHKIDHNIDPVSSAVMKYCAESAQYR